MTEPFACTINGRTSQELPPDEARSRISATLGRMDGEALFAYSLWQQPEGVDWGDALPPDWPHEFIQSSGASDAMSVEIRRLESDEPRQYAIGKPGESRDAEDRVIVWGPNRRELTVAESEVFTAEEASQVYRFYYENKTVPPGYTLRLLDLTYPKPEASK